MPIPEEILKLKPKNTRIKATRTPNEYNVIKRTSVRKNGKPYPVELGIIGKIIDGKYIPIEKPKFEVEFKSYGLTALIYKECEDIFYDLCKFYHTSDAKKIFTIALLRVVKEDLKDGEILLEYKTDYISEIFPKLGLSGNNISAFLEKIGQTTTLIEKFMSYRISKYINNPIVIDGMLKSSTGDSNIYSEFSRKGRIKGCKDINLIYAYDLKNEEPLACAPYAGNMLDFTALKDFLKTYTIENGFIIMDKGFNDKEIKEELKKLNTNFLIPIKNYSKDITKYELNRKFTESFKYENDSIRCNKVKVDNNKYYYAYKSSEIKAKQEKSYVSRNIEKGVFDEEIYKKKEDNFGLIVFESNFDGNLRDIYKAYKQRWEIETLFYKYKNIINRTEENVHGTYRLMATEFINYISCIMLTRIKKPINKSQKCKGHSLSKVMHFLSKCVKKRSAKNPEKWVDCATLKYIKEICQELKI
ncbi:MAG: transposase [Bdellovibrionota bacterium]|jgi:hypothetical protein